MLRLCAPHRILLTALAAVFVWAGLAKALDTDSLRPALRFLLSDIAAGSLRPIGMACGLAGFEVFLGVALLLSAARPLVLFAGAVIVTYTVFLGCLAAHDGAPPCACLGTSPASSDAEHHSGFVRNLGMLGALALAWARLPRARPSEPLALDDPPTSPSYFSQSHYYANLLHPAYFADRASIDQPGDFGERSRAARSFMTPYWMTHTAFARPDYWVGESPPEDLTLYAPVAVSDCAFPASKGLLLHTLSGMWAPHPGLGPRHVLSVALADGSVGIRPETPWLRENSVSRPYGATPVQTMSTTSGMRGRDF